MAEPKFSTGNTATRSRPTGAASALDSTCVSEPSTCRNMPMSPVASAWSMSSASVRKPFAAPRSFSTAPSILSLAVPSRSAADPAESDSPAPDARRLSRPTPTLSARRATSSAICSRSGRRFVSNSFCRSAASCFARAARSLIAWRSASASALPASSLSAPLRRLSRTPSMRPATAFMRATTASSAGR